MTIPKKIKIGNRTVPVEIVDYSSDDFRYDGEKITIQIDKKDTKKQQVKSFWLELTRAVFDYVNLLAEIKKEVDDVDLPDMRIENMGEVMSQIIADNNLDK